MQGSREICFLSGLEIPSYKTTREHYYPRSLLPKEIYSLPENIVPACKIINNVKDNLLPCEWEDRKIGLILHAIKCYHIKSADRKFLRAALDNFKTYKINPCDFCVARKFEEYCVNSR